MEAFNGPLGKALKKDVWTIAVGTFEVLPVSDFPLLNQKVRATMSSDARTLYDLCLVVMTGNVRFHGNSPFVIDCLIHDQEVRTLIPRNFKFGPRLQDSF